MSNAVVFLNYKPYKHQTDAHAQRLNKRFMVMVWHRRAGKTVFAVLELLLAALACDKERGRFGYIAPLLKQAKAVAWDYLKHFSRAIPGCTINESELYVELPNGHRVRLFGSDNPDAFRGLYFDGVVLDEVADMRPEVWGVIIRPALADRNGWAIFIGTPKGTNLFSELYYRAQSEDGWGVDLKRAADTEVLPPDELERAKREMSPPQYAQEFNCDFAAAVENALIRLDEIIDSQARTIREPEYEDELAIMGVDVARFGDDRTVIFRRQGRHCEPMKIYRGLDTMQVTGEVAHMIDEWSPAMTFVDQTGVGGGVIDRLNQLGYRSKVQGVDNGSRALGGETKFANRRAEMWWLMAKWIKDGGVVPVSNELAAELSAPAYWYDNQNRLKLESKDDLKRRGLPSPDLADALALTFAAPVAHPELKRSTADLAVALLSGSNLGRRRRFR